MNVFKPIYIYFYVIKIKMISVSPRKSYILTMIPLKYGKSIKQKKDSLIDPILLLIIFCMGIVA